jgi:crossover junction endodeoxyribonuclease RuvC
MRVLAIDPGYDRMGVAVLEKNGAEKNKLLYSDCIRTSAKTKFADRLFSAGQEIEAIIKKWKPEALAIETLFFNTNQKTGIHIAEIRGMILYLARTYGLNIHEHTPLEVKMAVAGYGRADKKQVTSMVSALIKLEKIPKYDDEYDAIAIGLTCLATIHYNFIHKCQN